MNEHNIKNVLSKEICDVSELKIEIYFDNSKDANEENDNTYLIDTDKS